MAEQSHDKGEAARASEVRTEHPDGSAAGVGRSTIDPVVAATVDALHWRLTEAASRIGEAQDALERGQADRAKEKLFDIEPLIFDAGRVLSGSFVLMSEHRARSRPETDAPG